MGSGLRLVARGSRRPRLPSSEARLEVDPGGGGPRSSCTSDERDGFVAVVDGRPVGFVTVALNAFNERMGVIDIIGVDPDFQRRGIASQLTRHALDHMRQCGMDIAAVETGGDPGHAPARAAYEALGFTLPPSARYLKLLDQ